MEKKDFSSFKPNKHPSLLAFLGFFLLFLLAWFDEFFDFPHLFLGGEKTPLNWQEAFIESFFIVLIGIFIVMKLKEMFDKRKEAEKNLLQSQEALKLEKLKLEEVLNLDCDISSILKLNQLIDFVIEESVKLLNAKRCSLMMIDPFTKELVIKGAKGLEEEIIKGSRVGFGEGIAGKVAAEGKAVFIQDIFNSQFSNCGSEYQYTSTSFMVVPIMIHQKVVGIVNVSEKQKDKETEEDFTDVDFKILCSIVHQASVSIENAKYYQELEYLTRTDSMTGLYNHRHFVKAMNMELERAKRYKRPLSILMMDVDDFKYFNDTYGHLEGDKLLKKVSQTIKDISRDVDICCRYAGDEFIVILPETDIHQAKLFAEKLSLAIHAIKYKEEVSVSIGTIQYNLDSDNQLDLIRKVDQRLYEEKKNKKRKSSALDH